jgi:hypothetical protein
VREHGCRRGDFRAAVRARFRGRVRPQRIYVGVDAENDLRFALGYASGERVAE